MFWIEGVKVVVYKSKARKLILRKEWKTIPWRKLERKVFKLQNRIFKASQRGDYAVVRWLQKLLMRSWSARCLAVRKVTQDNRGKKTAGVDGVKNLSPKQRLQLVNKLDYRGHAKPTRRIWIPKPGKTEKRPLSIPTMSDRARQALVKLGMEPEWEVQFEGNSYGFRPGRSTHDAIEAIFNNVSRKAKYVLDADISKCFDRINHEALLNKINTFPSLNRTIKSWLKSGVFDDGQWFPSKVGTPQGGVLSPVLANIALHGLETIITKHSLQRKRPALVRYADDFVVVHEDLEVIEKCQQTIIDWLAEMGLTLHPEKTQITHTLHPHEGKVGFDFLGFNVRQYPVGKYKTGKTPHGVPQGFKTLIKPSTESIRRHLHKLKQEIKLHIAATQAQLIERLNPKIIGWANYYAKAISSEVFGTIDHWLYQQLRIWANHCHSRQNQWWISNRYWLIDQGGGWVFAQRIHNQVVRRLVHHRDTAIRRHIKVKGTASPFDGDWVYWSQRLRYQPHVNSKMATLLNQQQGKCPKCELRFTVQDKLEIDHIIPRAQGGGNTYNNLQLLHAHCHHVKTADDCRGLV